MRLFLSALLVGFAAVGYIAVGSTAGRQSDDRRHPCGVVVDDAGAVVAGAKVELRVGSRVE